MPAPPEDEFFPAVILDLPSIVDAIQEELGLKRDGRFGPVTGTAVLRALKARNMPASPLPALTSEDFTFDARSEKYLATLDPKAQPRFRKFLALAKGVAASLGCDYQMISGHRTWAEQNALFAQVPRVTKARGGYSWHNFGVAGDFGVFQSGVYLDDGTTAQQTLAERVHKAVSLIAPDAGMNWGGNWKSIVDTPHFNLAGFPDSPTAAHRALYEKSGSVLD